MDTPDIIVNFVLDKSASMKSRQKQTISAVNEYIDGIRVDAKEKGQNVLFSLTFFDTSTSIVHATENIQDIPNLTTETYVPTGGTALLDALGLTVNVVASKVDEHKWRPAILCVIMTDGEENSSVTFNNQAISDLIAKKEQEGNWTFIYLGADKEAWKQSAAHGFSKINTVGYNVNNMVGTMAALRGSTSRYMDGVDTSKKIYGSADFFAGAGEELVRGIDISSKDEDEDEDEGQ